MGCKESKILSETDGSVNKQKNQTPPIVEPGNPIIVGTEKRMARLELEVAHMAACVCQMGLISGKKRIDGFDLSEVEDWKCLHMNEKSSPFHAITGFVSSQKVDVLKNIPFVAFSASIPETSMPDILLSSQKSVLKSKNGCVIGLVQDIFIQPYEELRNLGLIDWFLTICRGKSLCVITGHSVGAALACLLSAELMLLNDVEIQGRTTSQATIQSSDEVMDFDFDDEVKTKPTQPVASSGTGSVSGQNDFFREKVVSNSSPSRSNSAAMPTGLRTITFGAPRVFDSFYALKFEKFSSSESIWRFINKGDVVPTLRSTAMAHHFGDAVYFKNFHQGWNRFSGFPDFAEGNTAVAPSVAHNSLDEYVFNLKECLD